MLVSLCGTPGTGKTTVCRELSSKGMDVLAVNDIAAAMMPGAGPDPGSGTLLVDVDILRAKLGSMEWSDQSISLIEGHLSYLAPSDLCLLLRLDPGEVLSRLLRRGYSEAKARENAEAEGVGTLQIWAMEEESARLAGRDVEELPPGCGIVLEKDVTGMGPGDIASWVSDMVDAYREKALMRLMRYRPGNVDWMEVLSDWY